MTRKNCNHHPWPTEFWLLLTVITNGNGSILVTTLLLPFPYSYFLSVLYILCYRFYFTIKTEMPIAVDLCISLFCQILVTNKNWEFACFFSLFVNFAMFNLCYFATHVGPEYLRRLKENPEKEPLLRDIMSPLPMELWSTAAVVVHFVQGLLFVGVWWFPFGGGRVYWVFKVVVGYLVVEESVVFFNCYKEMIKNIGVNTNRA